MPSKSFPTHRLAAISEENLLDVPVDVRTAVGRTGTGWCDEDAADGDAHTIGISSPSMASDVLIGTLAAGTMRPTPIAILYTEYLAFIVAADSPMKTGEDILNSLGGGANHVTVSLATAYGGPNHIALASIIRHVRGDVNGPEMRVFPSARLAIADVVTGDADIGVITAASVVPEMTSGAVPTLAISSPEPLEGVFASCPTWTIFPLASYRHRLNSQAVHFQ